MPDAIDLTSATTLGVLQGLTEFLPVSSDGHIAIGAMLFGMHDAPLSLSVVLHAGTLVATLALFRHDVWTLLRATARGLTRPRQFFSEESGKWVAAIIVGSIPTAIIGLGLRDHVEEWARVPWIVGVCLLGSAAAVFSTRLGKERTDSIGLREALVIGLVQGLAVLPGLSRSGSTIAAAMLFGVRSPTAFRFSFLLSLPAVGGAVLLELTRPGAVASLPPVVWIGGLVAGVVGFGSLILLRGLLARGRFWAFSLYLVPLGLGMILWEVMQ